MSLAGTTSLVATQFELVMVHFYVRFTKEDVVFMFGQLARLGPKEFSLVALERRILAPQRFLCLLVCLK